MNADKTSSLKSFVLVSALALVSSLYGQGSAETKGDAAKGKWVFAHNECFICHRTDSTEPWTRYKIYESPGLKGVFRKSGLNEAGIRARINAGGKGMLSYKDILSDAEKNELIAYLKTL